MISMNIGEISQANRNSNGNKNKNKNNNNIKIQIKARSYKEDGVLGGRAIFIINFVTIRIDAISLYSSPRLNDVYKPRPEHYLLANC